MKVALLWMLEYIKGTASPKTLEEVTTLIHKAGLEVEDIKEWPKILSPFMVAEIIHAWPHPNANSLQICSVFDGTNTLQIICGAPNARKGIKVVMAPIGSTVPGIDLTIQEVNIRGEKSYGMLCSEKELGITKKHLGIIELPLDAIPGENPSQWLINETVLDVSITPNMSRAMSMMGMAREIVAMSSDMEFNCKYIPDIKSEFLSPISFEVEDSKLCSLAAGVYIKSIDNQVEVPRFITERLKAVDINSVSPVVDIVNYCFHEIGQPMHVYDAHKIQGPTLAIKTSVDTFPFLALDDTQHQLGRGVVTVNDDSGPVAIAGIIGSKNSSCTDKTSDIFLEAALFNKDLLHGTNIRTQSRSRFERGVDHEMCLHALKTASKMILDICGGKASKITSHGNIEKNKKIIDLPVKYLEKLSGRKFADDRIVAALKRRDIYSTRKADQLLECVLPSYLEDLESCADLVEEMLKVVGYDSIPSVSFVSSYAPKQTLKHKDLRAAFALSGYCDTMTWSFMSKSKALLFRDALISVKNPISDTMNVLRPSIIPNMLDAVSKNSNRGVDGMAIFEVGPVYTVSSERVMMATAMRYGVLHQRNIFDTQRKVDVFDIKADLISILTYFCPSFDIHKLIIEGEAPNFYHPSQSANISYKADQQIISLGHFGTIHPRINQAFEVKDRVVAMELYCNAIELLQSIKKNKGDAISKFPRSLRDFAFILDDHIKSQAIIDTIRCIESKIIKEINIFDIYKDKKIGDNKQSIAFSVVMQADDKTLTDEDIHLISEAIIHNITSKLAGKLRDGTI